MLLIDRLIYQYFCVFTFIDNKIHRCVQQQNRATAEEPDEPDDLFTSLCLCFVCIHSIDRLIDCLTSVHEEDASYPVPLSITIPVDTFVISHFIVFTDVSISNSMRTKFSSVAQLFP